MRLCPAGHQPSISWSQGNYHYIIIIIIIITIIIIIIITYIWDSLITKWFFSLQLKNENVKYLLFAEEKLLYKTLPLKVRVKIRMELIEIEAKNRTNLRDNFAKILKRKEDYQ